MATHSSILTWEILRIEEPGRLESRLESKRVRHDLMTKQQQSINNKTGLINTMRTCLSASTVFKLHQSCLPLKISVQLCNSQILLTSSIIHF